MRRFDSLVFSIVYVCYSCQYIYVQIYRTYVRTGARYSKSDMKWLLDLPIPYNSLSYRVKLLSMRTYDTSLAKFLVASSSRDIGFKSNLNNNFTDLRVYYYRRKYICFNDSTSALSRKFDNFVITIPSFTHLKRVLQILHALFFLMN